MNRGYVATSQEEAAATIGINRRTFAYWLSEGCPGENRNYVIADIITWARENKWGNDDAYIDSIENPDLKEEAIRLKNEKTRREIAKLEIGIDRDSGRLVDLDQVQRELNATADMVRAGLDRLQKQFGTEALDIVTEVLDEITESLQEA